MTIFINNINGFVGKKPIILFIYIYFFFKGHALVENLRTDNITDRYNNIIVGTLIETALDRKNKLPNGVFKVLEVFFFFFLLFFFVFFNIKKKKKTEKILAKWYLESDIIIYDIENTDLDEIRFALSICKHSTY